MKTISSTFLFAVVMSLISDFEVFAQTAKSFDEYIAEAQSKKLSYLPEYLMDRKKDCYAYQSPEQSQCVQTALLHAQEILSCPTSQKRFQEGVVHDDLQAAESFLKNGTVVVPQDVQKVFAKLQTAAVILFKNPFPIHIELAAYKSSNRNAHAAVGGKIFMTDGLWQGENVFSTEEIGAILAHELGHVMKMHGMGLNCMALEWVGSNVNVHEAQEAFQEDFRSGPRFEVWRAYSQSLEYEADQVATLILKKAGLDPLLMAQALEKLKPKSSGGFSSGSHPEFDVRIEAARKAAHSTF